VKRCDGQNVINAQIEMKFNEPLGFPLTAAVGFFIFFSKFQKQKTFFLKNKIGINFFIIIIIIIIIIGKLF
jgi:hypothetical protein